MQKGCDEAQFERRSDVLARQVMDVAKAEDCSIVTAESCTAGRLAAMLSEVPGAGERLHGGFVTYTKALKTRALGVSSELLERRSAVCREVAEEMAKGALALSPASVAVAITGVAGPEPDEDNNPVGLVCMAVAGGRGGCRSVQFHYGDRGPDVVLELAMCDALTLLADWMETGKGQSQSKDAEEAATS